MTYELGEMNDSWLRGTDVEAMLWRQAMCMKVRAMGQR